MISIGTLKCRPGESFDAYRKRRMSENKNIKGYLSGSFVRMMPGPNRSQKARDLRNARHKEGNFTKKWTRARRKEAYRRKAA